MDFLDDGGARAWQTNQATWRDPRLLDVLSRGRVRQQWPLRRSNLDGLALAGFLLGIGPGILVVLVLIAAFSWDTGQSDLFVIVSLAGAWFVTLLLRIALALFRRR
jgi:hypothetical protein